MLDRGFTNRGLMDAQTISNCTRARVYIIKATRSRTVLSERVTRSRGSVRMNNGNRMDDMVMKVKIHFYSGEGCTRAKARRERLKKCGYSSQIR